MSLWTTIATELAAATGKQSELTQHGTISGGCINQAMQIQYGEDTYFIKLNSASLINMFQSEALGLYELRKSQTLRVPEPICWGHDGESAFLVMEYLELSGQGDAAALGEGLAAMHQITQPQYGWKHDNTIGSTPRGNYPEYDWITFWREHRLQYQLDLAASQGHGGRLQSQGEQLLELFPVLFEHYSPPASSLHGDLWSGNRGYTPTGEPVIIDPAVYYGDREADLAMTELFGGFGSDFYAAYRAAYPVDSGYSVRRTLYNLYHILNHLNLFGGGYLSQAQGMMDSLLGELR